MSEAMRVAAAIPADGPTTSPCHLFANSTRIAGAMITARSETHPRKVSDVLP